MKTLLVILLLFTTMAAQAQNNTNPSIEYQDVYSAYLTKHLKASRDFYVTWLNFDVIFESTWCVYLQSKGKQKFTFALIDEKHPSSPPTYGTFDKRGSFLTLQVENAEQTYLALKARKAPITYHLKKEDWGQIRFGLTDPNGLYIDIVQQVDPAPGYWDKYMTSDK